MLKFIISMFTPVVAVSFQSKMKDTSKPKIETWNVFDETTYFRNYPCEFLFKSRAVKIQILPYYMKADRRSRYALQHPFSEKKLSEIKSG